MNAPLRLAIVYDAEALAECALYALVKTPEGGGLAPGHIAELAREAVTHSQAGEPCVIVAERCVLENTTDPGLAKQLDLDARNIVQIPAEGSPAARIAIEAIEIAHTGADAIAIVGDPNTHRALIDALHRLGKTTVTLAWRTTAPEGTHGRAVVHVVIHATLDTATDTPAKPPPPAPAPAPGGNTQGTITNIVHHAGNQRLMYGFIRIDGQGATERDLFFHRSNLADTASHDTLTTGTRVRFVMGSNGRGPCATRVSQCQSKAA